MPPENPAPDYQPPNISPPVAPRPDVAPPMIPRMPFGKRRKGPGSDMLEPGEELVTIVRRHPIGIIGYYIEVFFGLLVVIVFFTFLMKSLGQSSTGLLLGVILLALTVLVFFLFVVTYVYRQNRLLVTDRSLVQVLQKSLFIRKVSRLSLSNVEDVSAESRGILASIFGYGTLLIQTAGALDNFEFPYCPNPTFYADQIIEARQRYAMALQEDEHHPAEHAVRGQ